MTVNSSLQAFKKKHSLEGKRTKHSLDLNEVIKSYVKIASLQISKEDSTVLINVYGNQTFKNRANLWKAISYLDINVNH
jgi:hypothetical protein